jgi:putative component of toxin-antitoxin plasmid stabilization module
MKIVDECDADCGYVLHGVQFCMAILYRTALFSDWLSALRDERAEARIVMPLVWMEGVALGDATILLLCGGGKDRQSRDIGEARRLAGQGREIEWT